MNDQPYRFTRHLCHMFPGSADLRSQGMASGSDSKNASFNRANGNITGNNMYGNGNQYGTRAQRGQYYGGMQHNANQEFAALAHGFQGMNVHSQSFASQARQAMMSTGAGNYGALNVATAMPSTLYGGTGQYVHPGNYGAGSSTPSPNAYTPHASQYMPQMGYQGYPHHDNSPLSQNWTPTTGTTGEVPTLITPRRDSISSNENDQPATPSYAGYPGYAHGGVAINRSPSAVFTHSTPSPTSMMGSYGMKQADMSDVAPHIKLLLSREPSIPRAIPAPSSPLKPLDRALENQRGETNVYIRGLLPETTDEMLEAWGKRFGDIKSSKSIIDMNTGLCKGFGFVKYHNYEDAENCIRGFHYLGYEVSFARESFYSKLKTFADEGNTNLYVSNLPKSMNEHELAQLFAPHKVCSSRILRNSRGEGRGVGFARFETREDCAEVIEHFSNHTIKSGEEELQIQIRFADTQEQKSLKQQTQAARQFRSAEYEYATQAWRQARLPYAGSASHDNSTVNDFDQYLGTTAAVPIQGQRWAQSAIRQMPPRGAVSTTQTAPGVAKVESEDDSLPATSPKINIEAVSPERAKITSPLDATSASEQA